ncbi:Pnap_2097 family protein [Albirhodobacter sp. R86504]|uniref:Pnap_2097 family protein n=1 Tax=Albirhodobacter sp. R86504 TaxID=3093848 RepID=UPI0036711375
MTAFASSRPFAQRLDRPAAPQTAQEFPLGMMQLGPSGLSEQWVLRAGGDRHWALIAQAMGQEKAVFHDAQGREIYAAFCATSLTLTAPAQTLLGQRALLTSTLFEAGPCQLGSTHKMTFNGQILAELMMISAFVGHDDSRSNHRITRRHPRRMPPLPAPPPALALLALEARRQARQTRSMKANGAAHLRLTPCPSLDFNAVGLLYFPSFSALAERAEWIATGEAKPLLQRDMFYFGNLEAGESVDLYRRGENTSLCRADGQMIASGRVLRGGL